MKNGDRLQQKEMWAVLVDGTLGNLYLRQRRRLFRKRWVVAYLEMGSLDPLIEREFRRRKYGEAYDYFQNIAHRFHFIIIDVEGKKTPFEQVSEEILKRKEE